MKLTPKMKRAILERTLYLVGKLETSKGPKQKERTAALIRMLLEAVESGECWAPDYNSGLEYADAFREAGLMKEAAIFEHPLKSLKYTGK